VSKKDEIIDALVPDEPLADEERRRLLHFGARFLITICQFALLILMLVLLFYRIAPDGSRDLISAITGMLVISQKDAISYWFAHHNNNDKF
jgi:hypothetical protein